MKVILVDIACQDEKIKESIVKGPVNRAIFSYSSKAHNGAVARSV